MNEELIVLQLHYYLKGEKITLWMPLFIMSANDILCKESSL